MWKVSVNISIYLYDLKARNKFIDQTLFQPTPHNNYNITTTQQQQHLKQQEQQANVHNNNTIGMLAHPNTIIILLGC